MFWRIDCAFNLELEDHFYLEALTEPEAIIKAFKYLGKDIDFWLYAYINLPSTLKIKIDFLKRLKETDLISDLSTEELIGLFQDEDWLIISNNLEDWGIEHCIPIV